MDIWDTSYKENKTQGCDRVWWTRQAWLGRVVQKRPSKERHLRWDLVREGANPAKTLGAVSQAGRRACAKPLKWEGLDTEEEQDVTQAELDASSILINALCKSLQQVFSCCTVLTDFLSSPWASLTGVCLFHLLVPDVWHNSWHMADFQLPLLSGQGGNLN